MTQEKICYVPGKLMIAGEYAVLQPESQAVVAAVNRYMKITVVPSATPILQLPDLGLVNLDWSYQHHHVAIQHTDQRLQFIKQALETALTYIDDCGDLHHCPRFTLTIDSHLDHESGRKYGLGSSAAMTVGVIRSVLSMAYGEDECSPHLLFKLAVIAHYTAQKNGSGADIAASAFGGLVHYSAFSSDWLNKQIQHHDDNLVELVNMTWDYHAHVLPMPPNDMTCLVGWTGSPISTGPLVQRIQQFQQRHPDQYETFLRQSSQAVEQFVHSIGQNHTSMMLDAVKQNRSALLNLQYMSNTLIETDSLQFLADSTEKQGGAAKSSGAGGGDCGVAFITAEKSHSLQNEWQQHDILPLDLTLTTKGAHLVV